MPHLSRKSRRGRRRAVRHMIHESPMTLDLTPEEILAELDPNWFRVEPDGALEAAPQVRTDEAAA